MKWVNANEVHVFKSRDIQHYTVNIFLNGLRNSYRVVCITEIKVPCISSSKPLSMGHRTQHLTLTKSLNLILSAE